MSSTITARLADMQATLATYNAIETDLAAVTSVLNAIANESSDIWKGESATVFNNNMFTLMTQAKAIAEHVSASKIALTSSINAYKALEDSNTNDVTVAGETFVSI